MRTDKLLQALNSKSAFDRVIAAAFLNPEELQEIGKGGQSHLFLRVDKNGEVLNLRVIVEEDDDPDFSLVSIEDGKAVFRFCNYEDGHSQTTQNILNGAFHCLVNPNKNLIRFGKNGYAFGINDCIIKPGEDYIVDFIIN